MKKSMEERKLYEERMAEAANMLKGIVRQAEESSADVNDQYHFFCSIIEAIIEYIAAGDNGDEMMDWDEGWKSLYCLYHEGKGSSEEDWEVRYEDRVASGDCLEGCAEWIAEGLPSDWGREATREMMEECICLAEIDAGFGEVDEMREDIRAENLEAEYLERVDAIQDMLVEIGQLCEKAPEEREMHAKTYTAVCDAIMDSVFCQGSGEKEALCGNARKALHCGWYFWHSRKVQRPYRGEWEHPGRKGREIIKDAAIYLAVALPWKWGKEEMQGFKRLMHERANAMLQI